MPRTAGSRHHLGGDFTEALDLVEAGAWDYIADSCSCDQLIDRIRSLTLVGTNTKVALSELEGVKGLCRRLCASIESSPDDSTSFAMIFRWCVMIMIPRWTSPRRSLHSRPALSGTRIEGVLQTALEFILGKTGPTNAAIFLADSPSSYSLGAYVNCDCPREQADPVLSKFAKDVCHHVAEPDDLVRFQDVDAFIEAVGSEAEILESSEIVGCHAVSMVNASRSCSCSDRRRSRSPRKQPRFSTA